MIIAIAFIFFAIIGRFFYVSVIWGAKLQEKAIDQWTRELPILASRGEIFDRNYTPLVSNLSTYTVFIRTRSVTDSKYVANTLANILNVDEDNLFTKMEEDNISTITVKRQVGKDTIAKIMEHDLKGVYFSADSTRFYPYDDILSNTLGYTSVDGNGLAGIELYYNKYLKGYNGEILYPSDLIGRDLSGESATYMPATNGLNLQLTIDYELQQICQSAILKAYSQYNPKQASVIVMDCNNGEILALASSSSVDLNNLPRDDISSLNSLTRNSLISDSYEPGSTFKIITSAINIEEDLKGNELAFDANYIFNSSRYRVVDGKQIKCWYSHKDHKHSNQTLQEALNNSCNPCFVDIGLSLGKDTMYSYIEDFGFGNTTGVDFTGEALGMLIPEQSVTQGDLARIAFGQTIAITPIQLMTAVSASINGGYIYEPFFVKSIFDENNIIAEEFSGKLKHQVISNEASAILTSYLENVVTSGSGHNAFIEGYQVGGKTGTAQKYENGIISSGKYIMSFIGFFPASKPKYIALAIVDEPVGGLYGSTVAAPVVKDVFLGIIQSKKIQPYE